MHKEAEVKIRDRFNEDTANHEMEILRDNGVNRHLRFRKPGTGNYGYDLIAWPGYLCICGDMGTYVFSRADDMFTFFRGDNINPSYWGEKLQSIGTNAGYEEFSEARFEERVKEHFDMWEFENDAVKTEVWEDVKLQVLSCTADGSWPAYYAVTGYESDHGHRFQDFFDGYGCDEYTFHYIWILYAIIAGIRKYDATKPRGSMEWGPYCSYTKCPCGRKFKKWAKSRERFSEDDCADTCPDCGRHRNKRISIAIRTEYQITPRRGLAKILGLADKRVATGQETSAVHDH